ncbi:MAG: transcription antitermination factor NusB [Spirochaetes bacterium GWF1_41_5]|nr:MAG: transcription antitermination factor NusB [Spirochaetes bacterium GWF1_41_5]
MLAVQALYAAESCGIKSESEIGELCSFPWDDSGAGKEITDQAALLVRGSFAVLPEIDAKIKQRLINWDFSRISIVNKSILRLSIYSMLYEKSSPSRLIINEAVDLAKIFSDEEGYKFINALLDRLRKDEESKAPPA